jgi:hypothetical protein
VMCSKQWLDISDPGDPLRRTAVYHLIKLAADSEQLPCSLDIHDVDLGGVRDYVRIGGMADIYRGTYRGRPVAIKKLRMLSDLRSRLHKVTLGTRVLHDSEPPSSGPRKRSARVAPA